MTEEVENVDNVDIADDIPASMDKAIKQGWRPIDEWEGDPDDWVDYKEFNFRGELMERIRAQSKELNEFKKTAKEFKDHYQKVKETAYKEALQELKAAKRDALEEQDYDRVVELDEQIQEVKEKSKEASREEVTTNEPPAFVQYWLKENSWYETDRVMRMASEAIAQELVESNPELQTDQAALLDEVAKRVRKEFPHKFQVKNTTPSKTTTSTAPASKASKSNPSVNLSRQEQEVAERFVKLGFVSSVEEYAKSLKTVQG